MSENNKEVPNKYKKVGLLNFEEKNTDSATDGELFPKAQHASDNLCDSASSSSGDACYNAFRFSYKFFSKGIKSMFTDGGCPSEDTYKDVISSLNIDDKITKMSTIFKDIATVPVCEYELYDGVEFSNELRVLKQRDKIGDFINNIIDIHYEKNKNRSEYLLYIKGPIGCYKNRLLQYIYLKKVASNFVAPVFYIDFVKYESIIQGKEDLVRKDIKEIKDILLKNNGKNLPLLILDNIRGFECGQKKVYDLFLNDLISVIKCKIIASRDVEFNRLQNRTLSMPFGRVGKYQNHKYVSGDYANELSITSLNINRHSEANDFILNSVNFFINEDRCSLNNGALSQCFSGSKLKTEELYKFLIDLSIFTLDAYQLKQLLLILADYQESNVTLPQIYAKYYNNLEISPNSNIEESVFKFDYTSDPIDFGDDWYKIREHKSFLDYVIAQYYCKLLTRELNRSKNDRKYDLPDILFPKSVTRFIVPKYAQDNKILEYISEIFVRYKDNMISRIGMLAQLAFLLGRSQITRSCNLLKNILQQTQEELKKATSNDDKEGLAFLLRSLYVSLIYKDDKDESEAYCNTLISDEILHKNINIGFHLDYYGDKAYAFAINKTPGYKTVSVAKCLNTLRKLSSDINCMIAYPDDSVKPARVILQIITYCQILKERNYQVNKLATGNEDFIKNIEYFLITVLYNKKSVYEAYLSENIRKYFENILSDIVNNANKAECKKLRNCKESENKNELNALEKIRLYNTYSALPLVGRKGWINRGLSGFNKEGIKDHNIAESVAEHTFNCWLLGYLFLPDHIQHENITDQTQQDKVPEYDKNTVLNLIMVHDCGEVIVGDQVSKDKQESDRHKENIAMQKLIMRQDPSLLELWQGAWGYKKPTLISDIAYDIDRIQAVYQYLYYYCDKECKIEEDIEEWLKELLKIRTEIGRDIMKKIILKNWIFHEDLKVHANIYNFKKKYLNA